MTRPILLALLLCSCGGRLDGWDPPPDATEVELAAITSALESWCDATGRCDTLVPGGANVIRIGDLGAENKAGHCHIEFTSAGHARSTITLDDRRERPDWPEYVRSVAMHELGHHYRESEGHLAAPVGVLHPCVDVALSLGRVTEQDVTGELVDVGAVDCDALGE